MAAKVGKDIITTGIKGWGQDYLGAVKGAMTVVDDVAYPICKTFGANGIDEDDFDWDDEANWFFPDVDYEQEWHAYQAALDQYEYHYYSGHPHFLQ